MIVFIDEHRSRFGVEPICRVLTEHGCKIAPRTYPRGDVCNVLVRGRGRSGE